ncbi:MAG: hypothetical protein ACYDC3_02795 [Candidatus Binataceae bacterium]
MKKIGKSALTVLTAIVFSGAMAIPAIAGHPYRNTADFMSRNPGIASQLQQNPKLIDNRDFVKSNPELHKYLRHHPEARGEFRSHPEHFVHKEDKYQNHHN